MDIFSKSTLLKEAICKFLLEADLHDHLGTDVCSVSTDRNGTLHVLLDGPGPEAHVITIDVTTKI